MISDDTTRQEFGDPEKVTLSRGRMRATVSALGAELIALEYDGLPLLWTPDPVVWPEHAPLLFPVIGGVEKGMIRVAETRYPMPLHGFAKSSRFTVRRLSEESFAFLLRDTPESRRSYPYCFELQVIYDLSDQGIAIRVSIANPGEDILPASFGFHPGLRWPLEPHLCKSAYSINFPDDDELTSTRPRMARLTAMRENLPLDDHSLPLDESMFERSGILLLSPNSTTIRYGAPDAHLSLSISSVNCPNLTLWMRPGADFLCIEPWHGLPEPENFDGHFTAKPGIELIPPGGKMDVGMSITVKDRDLP